MTTRPRSSTRLVAPVALVTIFAFAASACGILEKLKGAADAGFDAAPTADTAVASASASANAAAGTASTPPADPAPVASSSSDPFTPPGPCVDPLKDARKRRTGLGEPTLDDLTDLDGDGKKERVVGFVATGMNWPFEIYVMRGACGHWVGEVNGKGVSVTALKSKGLKSVSTMIGNPCSEPCGCVNQEIVYFFNGKTYTAGKAKDVPFNDPCDAGKPGAVDAGKPAATFKVGDKINVEWKGANYPASIIQVAGKDQYKIHYDGYGKEWDEVVGPARIKGKR